MKGLKLLYLDELVGFARSRVMHVLFIGLPALTVLLRLVQPDTEGVPLFSFVAILVSSIGGTLSAVLLSTTVTNERTGGVYDLFLIRPVSRGSLLLSKFFAALSALLVAVVLSMAVGVAVDLIAGRYTAAVVSESLEAIVLCIAGMAVACSVGLFFGTVFDSVAVSAILAVYLGNQLSALVLLPAVFFERIDPMLFALVTGVVVPAAILVVTIRIFSKKTV